MSPLRHFRRIHHLRDTPRQQLRSRLRSASRGNREAYQSLAANYLNLVLEYLYFSGFQEAATRREVAREIFSAAWTRLPFAIRLSDFEYLLYRILVSHQAPSSDLADPLARRIAELPANQRFALVAREMEDWHAYWIGLACREKVQTTRRWLQESRCLLSGLNGSELGARDWEMVREVSFRFDQEPTTQEKVKLARCLESLPRVLEFKSNWLERRCRLIELRQDLRLDETDQDTFVLELGLGLTADSFIQPHLAHRLFNMLRFNRFPEYNPS